MDHLKIEILPQDQEDFFMEDQDELFTQRCITQVYNIFFPEMESTRSVTCFHCPSRVRDYAAYSYLNSY